MIDWTKPIRQKNGREAVYLEPTGFATMYKHWVAVDRYGGWVCRTYTNDGLFRKDDPSDDVDLENIPEIETRYAVLSDKTGFETLAEAKDLGKNWALGYLKIHHDGTKLISVEIVE